MMSKCTNNEKIRQSIINTALHLCLKEGLPHLEIERIASEIGIYPIDDIHLYFETKEALIKEILQQHLENIKKYLNPQKQEKTLKHLLFMLKESTPINEEESSFLPIYSEAFLPYIQSHSIVKEYQYFFNELHDFYKQALESRIQLKKLNPNTNTDALARILISMLDGAILHKGILNSKKRLELKFVKKAIELFKKELCSNKEDKQVA